MEVDETHDFVLENGIVAHNCYDETRYFLMSRPIAPRMPTEKPRTRPKLKYPLND